MREYLINLYPKKQGSNTQARVFAHCGAAAIDIARKMYPDYRTGFIKEVK